MFCILQSISENGSRIINTVEIKMILQYKKENLYFYLQSIMVSYMHNVVVITRLKTDEI